MKKNLDEKKMEYYFLCSVRDGWDFHAQTFMHLQEVNFIVSRCKAFYYIDENIDKLLLTEKGNDRISDLRKDLKLKGLLNFLMPNFNQLSDCIMTIHDIYLK